MGFMALLGSSVNVITQFWLGSAHNAFQVFDKIPVKKYLCLIVLVLRLLLIDS